MYLIPTSTFQLRLAAFQVFTNHRWLVTSGLHRTTLDALLVRWLRTPVFAHAVRFTGLDLPLHLDSSNQSTFKHHLLQDVSGDLRGQESCLHSTPLCCCTVCLALKVILLGFCHLTDLVTFILFCLVLSRVHGTMGTCYIIFKLNYTFMLCGGKLLNFSMP